MILIHSRKSRFRFALSSGGQSNRFWSASLQGEDENFFLYMAQPPARVATEDIPRCEHIRRRCLGSMSGFPSKPQTAVNRLDWTVTLPTDYFNVVLFCG
jgi:hypothetical protein